MEVAVFLTAISSADVSGGRLSLTGSGVSVGKANVHELIDRYRLTPYSVEADAALPVVVAGRPIRRVVICHGSLEEPTVFGIWLQDRVLWTSRGWVHGDSLARRTRLFEALVGQRDRVPIELNALCNVESITLDDVTRLSELG